MNIKEKLLKEKIALAMKLCETKETYELEVEEPTLYTTILQGIESIKEKIKFTPEERKFLLNIYELDQLLDKDNSFISTMFIIMGGQKTTYSYVKSEIEEKQLDITRIFKEMNDDEKIEFSKCFLKNIKDSEIIKNIDITQEHNAELMLYNTYKEIAEFINTLDLEIQKELVVVSKYSILKHLSNNDNLIIELIKEASKIESMSTSDKIFANLENQTLKVKAFMLSIGRISMIEGFIEQGSEAISEEIYIKSLEFKPNNIATKTYQENISPEVYNIELNKYLNLHPEKIVETNLDPNNITETQMEIIIRGININPSMISQIGKNWSYYSKALLIYTKQVAALKNSDENVLRAILEYERKITEIEEAYNNIMKDNNLIAKTVEDVTIKDIIKNTSEKTRK